MLSTGEYLRGAALLLLPLLATALLTAGALRRFGHLDRVERTMAATLVALAAYLAIHGLPLALGVLSQGTVLAAAALAAGVGALGLRTPATAGAAPARATGARGSGRVEWGLLALLTVPVLVALTATTRFWLARSPDGVDINTFHLPNVARWLQSGSLWQIDQFVPLQAHGYYPNTGDLLHVATLLPWDNDFAYRLPTIVLVLWIPACLWALARELGAPTAAALLVGVALAASPSITVTSIPSGLPDALVCVALPAGALFLLRHARTGLRSDLALGALGLGLAFGTKWYAVSAVGVIGLAVAASMLLRGRRSGTLPRAVADVGLLVGGVTLTGGIWLLRNLVEEGNPFFPVRVPGLFDAPEDTIRAEVGWSILHYAGDPGILFGQLVGEYLDGAGGAPVGLALGVLLALGLLVPRRRSEPRVLLVAGLGVVLFAAYTATPFSALGAEGNPDQANFNARYSLPALGCFAVATAWALGRIPQRAAWALEAVVVAGALLSLGRAFPDTTARSLGVAVLALGLVGAAVAGAARVPAGARRPVLAGGLALLLAATLAYGERTEERYNALRFQVSGDTTVEALDRAVREAPRPPHVVVAGDWNGRGVSPVWAAFGPRGRSRVEQLATFEDGFLTNPATFAAFRAQLTRARPDLLVVGRGYVPSATSLVREERWARELGWRLAASSERLALYRPPA